MAPDEVVKTFVSIIRASPHPSAGSVFERLWEKVLIATHSVDIGLNVRLKKKGGKNVKNRDIDEVYKYLLRMTLSQMPE